MDENNEPHTNHEFRRYQAWYQRATRCRLRVQWTEDDYADIESSDDEDTTPTSSPPTMKTRRTTNLLVQKGRWRQDQSWTEW